MCERSPSGSYDVREVICVFTDGVLATGRGNLQPRRMFTAATGQQLRHDVALSSAGAMTTQDSKVLKIGVSVAAPELV